MVLTVFALERLYFEYCLNYVYYSRVKASFQNCDCTGTTSYIKPTYRALIQNLVVFGLKFSPFFKLLLEGSREVTLIHLPTFQLLYFSLESISLLSQFPQLPCSFLLLALTDGSL